MYPRDRCHVCDHKLIYDARKEATVCSSNNNHYILWDDGAISIQIDNILFEFYPRYNGTINKCRIFIDHSEDNIDPIYSLDSWIYIDKDNYLDVLERVKKLQVLK